MLTNRLTLRTTTTSTHATSTHATSTHRRHDQHRTLALALATAGLVGLFSTVPVAAQTPAQTPAAQTPAAPPAEAPKDSKRALEVSEEGLLRNIWWNQEEIIGKLGLKPEQRATMDAHFRKFLADHDAKQTRSKDSRTGFSEALQKGRWDEARRFVQDFGASTQALVMAQPSLKIDVLSQLTPEQLVAFARDYPHLFERPWYRQVTIGGGADRPVQRKRSVRGERLRAPQAPPAQPAPPPGGPKN